MWVGIFYGAFPNNRQDSPFQSPTEAVKSRLHFMIFCPFDIEAAEELRNALKPRSATACRLIRRFLERHINSRNAFTAWEYIEGVQRPFSKPLTPFI